MTIQVVVLAAGQGKRMYSKTPKMLQKLAGKPILQYVIETAIALSSDKSPIIVHGHQGHILYDNFSYYPLNWVEQKEQLGTGHALLQALPHLSDDDQVLVLCGDVPLLSIHTLRKLIEITPRGEIGFLTAQIENPTGYGRIKRDAHGGLLSIVEEKDANVQERAITEINPGIYLVPALYLKKWLTQLDNKNVQQEYYLTDIISLAVKENIFIHTVEPSYPEEILGINNKLQLAHLERFYQLTAAEKLLEQGVTLIDPSRIDIRGEVRVGRDVTIDVNVIFEGDVQIGNDCLIGAHVILRNVKIGDRTHIEAYSMLEGAEIASDCTIGPFARIRPGTNVASHAHIGNFVEVKNSYIGSGSKANHLSYIGDSEVGKKVNIGAGTITCNYDGINKHKTTIGDHAFIGSSSQLVAPVSIGEGATIGAGSTITKDAPPYKLTLARAEQQTIEGWKRK